MVEDTNSIEMNLSDLEQKIKVIMDAMWKLDEIDEKAGKEVGLAANVAVAALSAQFYLYLGSDEITQVDMRTGKKKSINVVDFDEFCTVVREAIKRILISVCKDDNNPLVGILLEAVSKSKELNE